MSQVKALPLGWKWVKLGDVAEINPRIPNKESISDELEVQFLPMKLVEELSGKIHLDEVKKYGEVKKGYTPFIENDVIFAKVTPCMENGKIALVKNLKNGIGFGSSEFHVVRSSKDVNAKFVFNFIIQEKFRREAQNEMTGAVGLRRVPKQFIENYFIPLPPLSIQAQIVEKLEALLSELDKGKAQLLTAQAQLKTYRQAVLKYAFEGKLTHKDVKEGELPKGWKLIKIDFLLSDKKKGMITGPFGMMLKKSEHQKSGIPVLGIENIGEGVFQMPNKIFITKEKAEELKNYRVIENDIIISRSGTVGEICLLPKKMENSIISTNLMRVRLNQSIINPKYFVFLFEGGKVRQQVFELCKGSSRAFLNQSILNTLDIPYCSIEEQELIVEEIESRLSVCDKLEETLKVSLLQSETLRQSLLKRAFEGRLL